MLMSRRKFLQVSGVAVTGFGAASSISWAGFPTIIAQASATIDPALHILNRLTSAARAEDIATIGQMGIAAYIDWQLQPEAISDPAIDAVIKNFPTLSMTFGQLAEASIAKNGLELIEGSLIWAHVYRAAFSERQLFERMVDFWTDHFNVAISDLQALKTVDDREVIRKHALGTFRELLQASAQSPAMIVFLNNDANDKQHPNENYGRELMELHTLGVDGGYTEKDVKAVARAFTGWTVHDGQTEPFLFDASVHDTDAKTILGHTFPAGRGIEDPLAVLDLLANHPATAKFISRKLIRRFVSDNPPQSLVDSTAQVFTTTGGDIRQIMRHILNSAEFMASAGQKYRRPLDFIVALLRLLHASVDDPGVLYAPLAAMGQIPFNWHPPNGYPDANHAWMNTSGLLNRWNAALQITDEQAMADLGIHITFDKLLPAVKTAGELVDAAVKFALGGAPIADVDRAELIAYVTSDGELTPEVFKVKRGGLLGLLLASPYFQWR